MKTFYDEVMEILQEIADETTATICDFTDDEEFTMLEAFDVDYNLFDNDRGI